MIQKTPVGQVYVVLMLTVSINYSSYYYKLLKLKMIILYKKVPISAIWVLLLMSSEKQAYIFFFFLIKVY